MEDHKQHTIADHSKPGQSQSKNHAQHDMMNHSTHSSHQDDVTSAMSKEDHAAHGGHGTDHTGHEQMFRTRFWWSLLLSIPVLLYSEMIQMWLGFTPPAFAFSQWIPFVFFDGGFLLRRNSFPANGCA